MNQKPANHSFHRLFSIILLVSLLLSGTSSNGIFFVHAQQIAVGSLTPVTIDNTPGNDELAMLITQDLVDNDQGVLEGYTVVVDHYVIQDNWMIIAYYVTYDDNVSGGESLGIAHFEDIEWNVVSSANPIFSDWLAEIPASLLSGDAKQYFGLQESLPSFVTALSTYSGHRLPWQGGVSHQVTTGVGGHSSSVEYWAYDFGMANGTEIWASYSGTVAYVTDPYGSGACDPNLANQGNRVVVNNDDGSASLYLHLQQNGARVSVGQRVNRGDLIGLSGNSGYVCPTGSGYHLHFQVQLQGSSWWTQSQQVIFDPNGEPSVNSSPVSGNYRSGGSCSGPSLSSPSEGYVSSSQTVSFSWSAVSGCTFNGYTFRIKDTSNMDSGGTTIRDTGEGGTSRTETIGSEWNNRDLWWGVKAANAPNGASWSVRRFRIEPGGSGCPSVSGEVKLFDLTNCGGDSTIASGIGLWSMASSFNDRAESIAIPSGWSARLYQNDNENSSESACFSSTDTNLNDNTFANGGSVGNNATWMRVYNNTSCSGGTTPNTPSLSSPSNGQSFNEGESINLSWSSTGSEYYGEVWGGPGGTLTFGWQSGTSKDIGSQWAGYTYSWHVKARNGTSESGWSETRTFTVRPGTPSNLSASVASCSQINLSWTDNSGNEEGYRVYRNGNLIATLESGVTSYQNTGLAGSTGYSYTVKAYRGSIESNSSNTVNPTTSACPVIPNTPSNFRVNNSTQTSITLAWDDVGNETGYKIYEWDGSTFVYLASVGANVTTFTETRGTCGWDEFYEVSAYNGNGESAHTGWIQGYTKPCTPILSLPGSSSNNPYNYDLTFQWNASLGATEYLVEWWGGPYSTMQPCGWNSSTSCPVGVIIAGNTYSWHVKARNSAGESPWSDTWTFTIQNNLLPDLVIQSITPSPSSPQTNQTVAFSVVIKNQGQADASGFYVDLFIDNAFPTDCNGAGQAYQRIDGLASGASQTITLNYSGFSTAGTHVINGIVDTNCEVNENNEGNNTESISVPVSNPSATLTVTKNGAGSGTVTSNPTGINCGSDCSETYANNTQVTLTASPAAGSTFGGWSGGGCSGTGSCVVTITAATTVTATFNIPNYTLTVTKNGTGGGTVTSSPSGINCGSDCSEAYANNTQVTLTATPSTGSTFAGWSGACTGTGTCTVTMNAARSVTATFNIQNYTLTVNKNGTGSGTITSNPTGINCGSDCSEVYTYNTSVNLTATPAVGSAFTGWSGACSGAGSCVVSMTAAKSVTATFNNNTSGDSYEPDNTSGQAKLISSAVPQTHNIVPATDEDWIKFQLNATSAVALEATGATNSDTRMWLYDSNLTQVEYSDDEGVDNYSFIDRQCSVDALPAGTYYVKIDEYGNDNEIPSYNLSFAITQDCSQPTQQTTVTSVGTQDGWILEKSETSGAGGTMNSTATMLRVGDDAANRQYRSILSFDIPALPEGATITSVTLKFKYAGKTGALPFSTHGNLLVDICNGAFKDNPALQLGDFKPTCSKNKALSYTNTKVDNWYSQSLNSLDFQYINLDGVTQFRLRFTKDDNNDSGADFLKLYSGNAAEADRPQLIIEFTP